MEEVNKVMLSAFGAVLFIAAMSVFMNYVVMYQKTYNTFKESLKYDSVIVEMEGEN